MTPHATPKARTLAVELGIDLARVVGTGKDGRITVADIRTAEPSMTVLAAVERDLEALRVRDADLARGTLAATALQLAQQLDDPENSATSKSMCARSLLDTLERLENLAPDSDESDGVDRLAEQRAKRLAKGVA